METTGNSLKLKNLEVILIDGLVVLTTIFQDKLNFWQSFEASSIPASIYDIQSNELSGAVWIFLAIALLTMLYAGARKSVPENQFLQLFYGIGLIGVLFLIPGLIAMAFNSLVISLPALLITYIMLMKQDSYIGFANKLYDHKSRLFILPILISLFISGAEYLMKTRIDFQYAGITMILLYLPIRFLLAFKEPYKLYHFLIIMATMVYFSIQTYANIKQSPTTPGWSGFDGYLGDKVRVVKQTDNKALLLITIKSDKKSMVVFKKADNTWDIDAAATRVFREKKNGDFSQWSE